MKKNVKILATLGPASDSVEVIENLIKAGANLFRLNFSHGTHEYHSKTLLNIKTAMKNLDRIVGVLQDISGPKVRIGELETPFKLQKGDQISFLKKEIIGYKESDGHYVVSINYPKILEKIKLDEYIYLYDGTIRAKVINTGETVKAVIENSGELSSKKGVNFPNTAINIDVLTDKDKEDIAWGVENKIDFFAVSFVQNAQDMINVRDLLGDHKARLIAKIEKFDAVENIDEIIKVSDGLMVARGDLGIEVPYYEVPTIQKSLIRKANENAIPIITATQMLLSMTTNERATRAEVSDVANAVLDGTDIVMLSEESAIGENPANVVETMSKIIAHAENIYKFQKHDKLELRDNFDIIQASVTNLADRLNVDAILSLTSSGNSAVKMSRFRPKTKILAFSHSQETLARLTSTWGVKPISSIKTQTASKMIQSMLLELKEKNLLNENGLYITTIGYPVGVPGSTNTIKILNGSEIKHYLELK